MIETSIYELSQIKGVGKKTLDLIKSHFANKNAIKLPRKTKRGDIEVNRIYNEDCLDTMYRIPDGFIDLTVTSPPYDNSRSYETGVGETWNFDIFKQIASELYRVTKVGGVVVWVVGDATAHGSESGTSFRQALHFMDIGFKLHDTMVYHKKAVGACGSPLSYWQAFEFMFVFTKGNIKTFNPIKDLEPKRAGKPTRYTKHPKSNKTGYSLETHVKTAPNKSKRQNVWTYKIGFTTGDDKTKHPAIFPEQLAQDHILSWSNPSDLVYDPFMGSGTTAKMAKLSGRKYIGSEVSAEYCKITEERLK